MNPRLFPTLLIILDVCSAAVWAGKGNARQVVYWLAAAALTTVVTY